MNANKTNTGMNVEDYEDMAVQNSNVAKRVAVGSAVFLGGAAVAGGAAYAANHSTEPETPLTEEEFLGGANVGSDYKPTEETTTTEQVVVEKPVYVAAPEEPKAEDPSITWDETTTYYRGDEKVGSIEEGTVEGHKFMLVDEDGDEHADYLMVDLNDDGKFGADEIVKYDVSDHVHMGHATAHSTDHHFDGSLFDDDPRGDIAENNINVHNDFEDEKTGESYHGDYAENNPDYNSHASTSQAGTNDYLAEREPVDDDENGYAGADVDGISNDDHDLAQVDATEDDSNVTSYEEETGDTSDDYDSMMGGDEFLA